MKLKNIINDLFTHNSPDVMSFRQGYDLTDLPVVTLYQNKKKFNFLLDTGSNCCIIDKNILDSIEHNQLLETSTVYGMEGNVQEVSACTITLDYKNSRYTFGYLVQDMQKAFDNIKKSTGVTLHGILGSAFFAQFKYVLDFDELIAYSKL